MTKQTPHEAALERLAANAAAAAAEQAEADSANEVPPEAKDMPAPEPGERRIMVMHDVRFGMGSDGEVAMRMVLEDLDNIRQLSMAAPDAARFMRDCGVQDVRHMEMRPAVCSVTRDHIELERVFMPGR